MREIKILTGVVLLFVVSFVNAQTFTAWPDSDIPDDQTEYKYPLQVSGIGTTDITNLQKVEFFITHTWDADLDIYLEAPNGVQIELTTDNGGSDDDYRSTSFTNSATTDITSASAPFTGFYKAEGDLSSLNSSSIDADGTWYLCITDDAGGDDGHIYFWSLTFGCNWHIGLFDSYGDGWNGGGNIEIKINGVNFGNAYVYDDDGIYLDTIWFDIPVNDGDELAITFNSGSYDDEDYYTIYNQEWEFIHNEGVGSNAPGDYTTTVSTCSKKRYTSADCEGAIKVCSDHYSFSSSAIGEGAFDELGLGASCWGGTVSYGETVYPGGEQNSTWFRFTVEQDGNLAFSIVQSDANDDYDWALFDVTGASCDDIINGNISSVACNWDISSDSTGMNDATSADGWEAEISVTAGDEYVLAVDNYTKDGSGYDIYFNRGTAVIYDNISPEIQAVTRTNIDTVFFDFSEPVTCSSVSTSDFSLDGPDAPYTIDEVGSAACDAGAASAQHYWIRVSPNLRDDETYTLSLDGDVDDKCSNTTNHNSDSFLPVKLKNFDFNCTSDGIELEWITLSEVNSSYFTIYTSVDGITWSEYEKIKAAGNSNTANYYSIMLERTGNLMYYKLTQTDFDGTKYNLATKYVSCTKFDIAPEITLSPNPVTEGGTIYINGEFSSIEVYDMIGHKINANINNNKIQNLSKGMYFIIIDNNIKKKIVVK
jgi:subtilisin-like proprotein convertase family protein